MLKFCTWNLEWAKPGEEEIGVIAKRLDNIKPDIAVLTEVDLRTLANWQHVCDAGKHELHVEERRKVAIVSQMPMKVVDSIGSPALPPNNFVAADVETPLGRLRVIGIVIRYNQKEEYVDALPEALKANITDYTILAGDFNLKMPNGPLSRRLGDMLETFGLTMVTAGHHAALDSERPLIDHIAVSERLQAADLLVWPRRDSDFANGEKEVTDHAGCAITITAR